MGATHIPVLREEVADNLASNTGRLFIDATVGGGWPFIFHFDKIS